MTNDKKSLKLANDMYTLLREYGVTLPSPGYANTQINESRSMVVVNFVVASEPIEPVTESQF